MPTQNWNSPWLRQNSERAFPLANDATRQDVTDSFLLPNDFLVGLYLAVPFLSSADSAKFFIKTLRVGPASVAIEIGYDNDGEILLVATAAVLKASHTFGKAYPIRGLGPFYDCSGHVIIGSFDGLEKQPGGSWQMLLADGRLEPETIRPQLRGVSGVRISNGLSVGELITGNIVFKPGRNMRITSTVVADEDPVIRFDGIDGKGFNSDCVCESATASLPPIKTINNIRPDASGNITLASSECIELEPITAGLRIKNTCSEPCCGCKELKTVTDQLEQFGKQAATLEGFVNNLEAQVNAMSLTVLGSRLGDRNCTVCE